MYLLAYGAVGLETLLPAAMSLHHEAELDLLAVLKCLTASPASILRLDRGSLAKGSPADLILFDPGAPVRIDPSAFRSRSKNSPFKGRLLQGAVLRTVVAGKTVFESSGK
jgi:dihydroorotase